jgi:hypothetical protein
MTQSIRDLENTFARAFVLLYRNWTIVVPGIVLGAIGFAFGFAILAIAGASAIGGVSGNDVPTTLPGEVMSILAAVVAVILALVTLICEMAYVTGMAGAAWKTGEAYLRDGYRAFEGRGTQIFVAVVLLSAGGFVAALLAPITLLLSAAAYAIFSIYTMAAVIIGNRTAFQAIAESCRLAWKNILPTLAVVGLVVLVAVAGGWIGNSLGRLFPIVGGLIQALVQQIVVAYATLVIVGEYLKLRDAGAETAAADPGTGTP